MFVVPFWTMAASSGETATFNREEVISSVEWNETSEADLELALANMAIDELLQKAVAIQTDSTSRSLGVNTDTDWESQVAAMFDYSATLSEKYEKLMLTQSEEAAANDEYKKTLQKKKEEATRQHQSLLDKLESLRVKLQLNNSKVLRKNFLSKKQEMTSEKNRAEEERNRLTFDLAESDRRLSSLSVEQSEERQRWQEELDELRQEMERVRREAQEAQLQALKEEICAVETQRDTAMGHIRDWFTEVSQYLNTLRADFPLQYPQERQRWERKEALVRRHEAELQRSFQSVLHQLQQGKELESLPRITFPILPQVPTATLRYNQVMQSLAQPHFMPPPPPSTHTYPQTHTQPHNTHPMTTTRPPTAPQRLPNAFHQQQQQQQQPPPFVTPPPPFPHHQRFTHPPPPVTHNQFPPLNSHNQHNKQQQPHHIMTPPLSLSPSPPVHPVAPSPTAVSGANANATSAPAGKLDKVLGALGERFPQCDRPQLTSLLQQVKSSRGTLAGMSMDEVIEQVGFKLAQNERSAPGPISRPAPLGPIQRPSPTPTQQRAAAAAAGGGGGGGGGGSSVRKLCLMCQNQVAPDSRYPLSCSHTIHRDCIQMWLQTSKNNTCPFCSGK